MVTCQGAWVGGRLGGCGDADVPAASGRLSRVACTAWDAGRAAWEPRLVPPTHTQRAPAATGLPAILPCKKPFPPRPP